MGNEAQETKQEESIGHWKYDKLPGGKERFQPPKTVKPINPSATLTRPLLYARAELGSPGDPELACQQETSSQVTVQTTVQGLNMAFKPEC